MKALMLSAAVVLLSGCSVFQRTVTVPVEVKIPVPVPCVEENDIPGVVPSASETLTKDDSPGEKIRAVLLEREQLRKTENQLRLLVSGCVS